MSHRVSILLGAPLGLLLASGCDDGGQQDTSPTTTSGGTGTATSGGTGDPNPTGDPSPTGGPTATGGPSSTGDPSPTATGDEESSGDDGEVIDPLVCDDDSLGSAQTTSPAAGGASNFTTELRECSLSPAEAAYCYGADHESSVDVAGDTRTITGNAIPNHDVDLFPNMGNPNVISAQQNEYTVTTSPAKTPVATPLRTVGVAVNGVKFEPATAETFNSEGVWRYAALTFQGRVDDDMIPVPPGTTLGLDCNFAHVQPTGEYHYHGNPTALMPEAPAITLMGWAADGFPILGRHGYEVPGDDTSDLVELTGSYRVQEGPRAAQDTETVPAGDYDGTFEQDWIYDAAVGDLDECNGRDETITLDGETFEYAYYLTHTYPFVPRCVWGTPDPSFPGMMGPPPGGV